MRRVGKGFSRVETPLYKGMIVAQQADDVADEGAASVDVDVVPATVKPFIPSPTQLLNHHHHHKNYLLLLKAGQDSSNSGDHKVKTKGGIIANINTYEDVTLKNIDVVAKDVDVVEKIVEIEENDDKLEPTELKEVVEVVTTAKLMTKVVTTVAATITIADTLITAATLTTALSAARRRKGVVIRYPEETATSSIIIHSKPKSKAKGKGIMVEEPKPLKKQAQIEQDEAYTKEWMEEEDSKALKRASESQAKKAAKKKKLDEEVAELKKHLQIVPNDEDDVYTEATPLAHKVLWQLVKERFSSSKPKNFSDDFLLTTPIYMFEKPDVQAQVWKNQKSVHGLTK
nr:hypothetical protein [Tanacetum cinerariifolium]